MPNNFILSKRNIVIAAGIAAVLAADAAIYYDQSQINSITVSNGKRF